MGPTIIGEKKYDPDMVVRAFEYFAISRSSYARLRDDYKLPSISLLKEITSTVKDTSDIQYLKNIFSKLPAGQRSCILLLDEIYVKPTLQYHGGNVFGQSTNNPNSLANTILSYMIVCMLGGPKFLFKMLPVNALDSKFLLNQTNLLLKMIHESDGNVVAVISDGNKVNQSLF